MDPVSLTASIVAILQLSSTVLGFLKDVKNASKDRDQCAGEVQNLRGLLATLGDRLQENNFDTPWYTAVQDLAIENGPLEQFKQALEALQKKITAGGKVGKAGNALIWNFRKEEVASILGRMERLKSSIGVALQMDHLSVLYDLLTTLQYRY